VTIELGDGVVADAVGGTAVTTRTRKISRRKDDRPLAFNRTPP